MVDNMKFCDKCRAKMPSEMEAYSISFQKPGVGLSKLFSKGQSFTLCGRCFVKISENVERQIMGVSNNG